MPDVIFEREESMSVTGSLQILQSVIGFIGVVAAMLF